CWIGRTMTICCFAGRTVGGYVKKPLCLPGAHAALSAGLVQMRAGLSPQANLDDAIRLIEQAQNAGAEYVLTPEMTNVLEIKRERLFATIVPEESDATLAALRELARK